MKTVKVIAICLLTLHVCFQATAQDVITIKKTISRSYAGDIGQKPARMNLSISNNKVSGELTYKGVITPIELNGTIESTRLSLSAIPAANYPGADNQPDPYTSKSTFSGDLADNGNITGSFRPETNQNSLDVHMDKIFEVTYIDTTLKAAYINHNTDFKIDTVYSLSLSELHFLNLPYRNKLRSIKYWYSFPLVSIMAQKNYNELNSLGGTRLEELGYIDGDYLLQKKKAEKHPQFPYHFKKSYSVAYVDQRLLSVESDLSVYDGSPHVYTNRTYKNYELNTGDSLKLDSLFLRGGKYYLDSVGEICFRKQTGLGPEADLATAGYFWNDSMFHVNSNFYFTISGICFVYNTYEIASYNVGITKFIIPYEMLKPIIRRRGPLGWVRNE